MGSYTILKNSTLEVFLTSDYQDNGWSFSEGTAIHDKCNSGFIDNINFVPDVGVVYKVKLTISRLGFGTVKVSLGGQEIELSNDGDHLLLFNTVNAESLAFWSDGDVVLSNVQVYEGVAFSRTLLFNQQNNQFVGYAGYTGDLATKFIDDFISFKNGTLFIHDQTDNMNTFYGEKTPSVITFYVNIEPSYIKDFYSIKLEGNDAWDVDVELPAREGNANVQRSRIKRGNFRFEKGAYYADFMRDINDPRFNTTGEALMRGAYLQGKYMKVTLTNNSNKKVELAAVEVYVSIK